MSERQIFTDKVMSKLGGGEQVERLADEVESQLAKLMQEHGVEYWDELPEEVLETVQVEVSRVEPQKHEDDNG